MHFSGTTAYTSQATVASAHFPLSQPHDHLGLPVTFTIDMNVAKINSFFWMKGYSKSYQTAAASVYSTEWQSGYVNAAAAAAATQLKAVRLLFGLTGQAFGSGSYVTARWSY